MAIKSELILELADLDRVSIECVSCHARVELSISALTTREPGATHTRTIPVRCPSCDDGWEAVRHALGKLVRDLNELAQYKLSFRLPRPAGEK